ncbi:MAG: M61 family metallopeptidase [Janthinobacterium lividum]
MPRRRLPLLAVLALLAPAARAAPPQAQPAPLPMPPPIPLPQDTPWPGTVTLAVDATDLARHIFTIHETIPVAAAGDLVVEYPKWIPGNHGPTGAIELLGGIAAHAGDALLDWTRDPVSPYAFHIPVPDGAHAVTLDFQFLSPVTDAQGRIVMTPAMLDLQWNAVVLYPAGAFARDIPVDASVRLPDGWHYATALENPASPGNEAPATAEPVRFRTVPLNVLLDSPLIAGTHFRRVDLAPGASTPVHLDIVADTEAQLAMTPEQLAIHRALVTQATRLYGSQHYDHYDFLLALSDELGGEGLEHHRSSENATDPEYFTGWDKTAAGRDLLSHEYTHSWDGKYRRPADLWSPDFNTLPERDSLLWVYEGMTEYWGQVLAARSGLWSRDQALDAIALEAADMQDEAGRAWRTLADTTQSPIFVRRRSLPWPNWQRGEDYYLEGLLLWLDADTLIREQTHGAKSLDDFAHGFLGTNDGSFVVSTYTFDDVVHALNDVAPHDWAAFLHDRLDHRGGTAPLDGLARGGYRLTMTDKKSDLLVSEEHGRKFRDFTYSVGLVLKDAHVASVAWNSPAFRAGIVKGDTILGVDGSTFADADTLADAITAAKTPDTGAAPPPIQLLLGSGKHYRTVQLDAHAGLQYPHLVRSGDTAPSLDAILAPRN